MASLLCLLGCGLLSQAWAGQPSYLPEITGGSGNPRLPGKFVWADLVTDDLHASMIFYQQLFGWRMFMVGDYTVALSDERPICGMFQRTPPKDRPAIPRWFGYISVRNVSKAEQNVTKGGGRILAPGKQFPKRGEQAVFTDPEGAVFGVIKSSAGDPEDSLAGEGEWIWIQLLSRNPEQSAKFYASLAGYKVVENTNPNRLTDYVLESEGYARATVRGIPKANSEVQPTWLPFVRVKDVNQSVARATELGGAVRLAPKPELFNGKLAVITDPRGAAVGLMEWSPEMLGGKR